MNFAGPFKQRLSYASFVLEDEKILYVETPKAACTTIKQLLRQRYPSNLAESSYFRDQSSLAMNVHNRDLHATPSLTALPAEMIATILASDQWMRICIVRNPYQRLFSCWRDKVYLCEPGFVRNQAALLEHLSAIDDPIEHFRAFVHWVLDGKSSNHHWESMHNLLCMELINYSLIVRLETMAADISPFLQRLAISSAQFERFRSNVSLPLVAGQYYSESLAAAVYQFYELDFRRFGYQGSSWLQVGREAAMLSPASLADPAIARLQRQAVQAIRERNRVIALLNSHTLL